MRPRKSLIPLAVLTAILAAIMLTGPVDAQTKGKTKIIDHPVEFGKISGIVTDSATGNPVVGASVLGVGTNRGAMTDFDGKYTIPQLSPGTYTLRISNIEFNTLEVSQVVVKGGITSEQSFTMTKKTTELEKTIKVVGQQDQSMSYEPANQQTITKEPIKERPVGTVDELIERVAGVVTNSSGEVIIRGGRAGEPTPPPPPGPRDLRARPDASSYCQIPLSHGGSAIVNGQPYDAMFFKDYGTNPFVDTDDDHLSTFAIDVDDASFVMARSYLDRGSLPPDEAIRVEEFVNHFNYDYEPPRHDAFTVYAEGAPSEFGDNVQLLQIGIKGRELGDFERKPANLVFVVDVSGSMGTENRLGLVRRALTMLVDELRADDRVGIVIYGSRGQVLLEPTSLRNRYRILDAIDRLRPGGSTNAEEGIRLGYQMARRQFQEGHINRVILCSDGVANVGRTGPDELLAQIKRYADMGITLTTVGFGMGNYNDVLMEKLGNKGNGFYAYVDDIDQARKIFVDNLNGTLEVIARDVKIQVDFNSEIVRSYRLLGYENRDVADNKFRDDREDGGEIGSGHEVTALYEVKLWKQRPKGTVATVYIRYKDPEGGRASEVSGTVTGDIFAKRFKDASSDLRLAATAAEFAEILRHSYWARGSNLDDVYRVARDLAYENESEQASELAHMIDQARRYEDQLARR